MQATAVKISGYKERKRDIGFMVVKLCEFFMTTVTPTEGYFPDIMKQISQECLWMEQHQLILDVYYDHYDHGCLKVSYDGFITFNDIPMKSLVDINFVWLEDVVGYEDCPTLIAPHEGERYINYVNNQMHGLSIYQLHQGKWIETIPHNGDMVYLSRGNHCVYFDGKVWNIAFNPSFNQIIALNKIERH